jgi:hypothetical protein
MARWISSRAFSAVQAAELLAGLQEGIQDQKYARLLDFDNLKFWRGHKLH